MSAPRVAWVPPAAANRADDAIALAATCGLVADDHQRTVLEGMLGVREDGKWAAFETGLVESRQNGKGGVFEIRELAGVFVFGEELLIHSAHEYATSLEAFYRMQNLIEANDELFAKVRKVRNAHGEQGFDFKTGQRLRYRTRTRGGGRGFSCDFLGLDEAMFLPEFAQAALLPTLSARPNPQVLYAGSAVDQEIHEHGLVLARLRERGMECDPGMAYFEWSLPFDAPDLVPEPVALDPEAWRQANPALDLRITVEHVAREQRSMSARNFAVERLGVGDWPRTDGLEETVIPIELWDALENPKSDLQLPVCIAFDTSPERKTAIAVAGRNQSELFHVEVHEHRQGTRWVIDRLVEMVERWEPEFVVCDAIGPASSLLVALEDADVPVTTVSAAEHGQALGRLVDMVRDQTLQHLGSQELRDAIRGAKTRPIGDGAFAWGRRSSLVDISPLVAATLALGAAAGVTGYAELHIY